jgi:tetratricopeptide (TPR) repeat protein
LRFYQRAFKVYDEGLKKYPKDFDLAYNKSHLQYLILTEPKLKEQVDGDPVDLLREALEAHRYALTLDETNADVLFNTAQVLTSLAEELDEEEDDDDDDGDDSVPAAIGLLQEAIELFESCATRQEMQFEESQAVQEETDPHPAPGPSEPIVQDDNTEDESREEWAVVTQPVTPLTLLETATATLTTMTALVSAYSNAPEAAIQGSSALAAISSLGSKILDTKVPTYLRLLAAMPKQEAEKDESHVISLSSSSKAPTRQISIDPAYAATQEVTVAAAHFRASLAEAEFRLRLTGANEYASRLKEAFESLPSGLEATPSHLFAYADSLADYAAAIAERERDGTMGQTAIDTLVTASWTALSLLDDCLARAIDLLAQPATKDVSPPSKCKLYLLRGDASLHRWRLSRKETATKVVKDAELVLLKNAGVYYRGAVKLASAEGEEEDTGQEASVKVQIVAKLSGEKVKISMSEDAQEVMESMIDEGLVETRDLEAIL